VWGSGIKIESVAGADDVGSLIPEFDVEGAGDDEYEFLAFVGIKTFAPRAGRDFYV
jgi:hypothetical protein